MKVIVAGSRDFFDYAFVSNKLNYFLGNLEDIEIVSGACAGVDELGARYAKQKNYKLKEFPADWFKFGLAAGPIRNGKMAQYADAAIIFWNGKTKNSGSFDMIERAKAHKLKLRIVRI